MTEQIIIRGAKTHNLKNIDCDLPHGKLTVISGVSGSGKSSLAFDTIYAEGQRRYVESLSAYARQFLERIEKPDVLLIDGLAPAIAIKQKNSTRNPRSTVATATEIYDYMRLLYARCGTVHCGRCGGVVRRDTWMRLPARFWPWAREPGSMRSFPFSREWSLCPGKGNSRANHSPTRGNLPRRLRRSAQAGEEDGRRAPARAGQIEE